VLEVCGGGGDPQGLVFAVAATQTAHYQQQAMEAAEAVRTRAPHGAGGNWSKLKQAREQSFYADAALAVARAEQVKGQTRERWSG